MSETTVGSIGASAIRRARLTGAARAEGARIVGIADPSPAAPELAGEFGSNAGGTPSSADRRGAPLLRQR